MKLSSKSEYAVLAMLELVLAEGKHPLPLAQIAARHHISGSYLELIFAQLRRAELVRSRRGPRGGFVLARPAADISVGEIVQAVGATAEDAVPEQSTSVALWGRLSGRIADFLNDISLAEIASTAAAPKEAAARPAQRAHAGIAGAAAL